MKRERCQNSIRRRSFPPPSLSLVALPRLDKQERHPSTKDYNSSFQSRKKGEFSLNKNFHARFPRPLPALLSHSAWSSHLSHRLLPLPRLRRPLRPVATSDDYQLILSTRPALPSPTSPSSTLLPSKRTTINSPLRTRRILRRVPASKHHRRKRFALVPFSPLLSTTSSLVGSHTYYAIERQTDDNTSRKQPETKVPWLLFQSNLPAQTPSRRTPPTQIVEQATAASI